VNVAAFDGDVVMGHLGDRSAGSGIGHVDCSFK
jgi:hypothetical protein